jgi:hypothetical protein
MLGVGEGVNDGEGVRDGVGDGVILTDGVVVLVAVGETVRVAVNELEGVGEEVGVMDGDTEGNAQALGTRAMPRKLVLAGAGKETPQPIPGVYLCMPVAEVTTKLLLLSSAEAMSSSNPLVPVGANNEYLANAAVSVVRFSR